MKWLRDVNGNSTQTKKDQRAAETLKNLVTNNRQRIQVSGNVRDVAEAMENMIVLQRMKNAENTTKEDILLYVVLVKWMM